MSADGAPVIRRMVHADADACARLQMSLIPGTVLNLAGLMFMRDVYFQGIADSPLCIAYVAVVQSRVVGVSACTVDYDGFAHEVRRKRLLPAARALALQAAFHPWDVLRFVCFSFRSRPDIYPSATAEGLTLVVDPAFRTGGTAVVLMERCFTDLDARFRGQVRGQFFQGASDVHRLHKAFGFKDPVDFEFMGNRYTMMVRECPRQGTGAMKKAGKP